MAESETKNASDEWVAIEENNDSRFAILSSLLDEDGDTIEENNMFLRLGNITQLYSTGLVHISAIAARLCFNFV